MHVGGEEHLDVAAPPVEFAGRISVRGIPDAGCPGRVVEPGTVIGPPGAAGMQGRGEGQANEGDRDAGDRNDGKGTDHGHSSVVGDWSVVRLRSPA